METKEWKFIDKSDWPNGPWHQEPDKMQFPDEETGLPCLIRRSYFGGSLCGYVGITEDHPLFGVDYSCSPHIPSLDCEINVHGWISFSGLGQETKENCLGICHIPGPGEPGKIWWFGFDCAHWFDLRPADKYSLKVMGKYGAYRDIVYVKKEIAKLAKQLAEIKCKK